MELGYWENGERFLNPLYSYEDYDPTSIAIDYQSVRYDDLLERAYFDLNNNGKPNDGDHILGTRIPTMFGKRFYSRALTAALADVLSENKWPADLATVEETEEIWPDRISIDHFADLEARADIHAMIIFATKQHVQAAPDAPSIHQAVDGLTDAGWWVRLNPDHSYVEDVLGGEVTTYEEHDAQTTPESWERASLDWGYASFPRASMVMPIAGILEMLDRSYVEQWSVDLRTLLSE